MKKILLLGVLAAGCSLSSVAQSKINNVGRVEIDRFVEQKAQLAKRSRAAAEAFQPAANVFVTLTDGYAYTDLEAAGFTVLDHTGDMAIVNVKLADVDSLAALEAVKSVDFPHDAAPLNDEARRLSFADACHLGSEGLDRAYKGKGVYVGLYDTGLDPNHVNFTDGNGKTRVKAIYNVSNGTVHAYEDADGVASFSTDNTGKTHGTHVLGTIAGSDNITGEYAIREGSTTKILKGKIPYYGVAPEADIIVGCGTFDNASIMAGMGKVIDRAKQDGKPIVLNLSLGHNRGSHDPQEPVNRYLDSRAQDAIVVVSAGNEGGSKMSIEKTVQGSGSRGLQTFIVPSESSMDPLLYTAEFWAATGTPFETTLILYNTADKKVVSSYKLTGESGSYNMNTSNNDVFKSAFATGSSVSVSWGVDSSTKRFNVYMINSMVSSGTTPIVFGVQIAKGSNGVNQKVYAYCDSYTEEGSSEAVFSSQSVSGYVSGSDIGSINGMACGYNTISVGAWVSRTYCPTLNGSSAGVTYGGKQDNIAVFSSYGKSGDGRQLPVVCAPGAQLISSVSNYNKNDKKEKEGYNAYVQGNGRKNGWDYMQGTSMAAPFVSGTIALWLEACPGMRGQEALDIIKKTSTQDAYTAKDKEKWGAGKINVLAGLKEAIVLNSGINPVLINKAEDVLSVISKGAKQFEVSCPGVEALSCKLFNVQGAEVAAASAASDSLDLDGSALPEGIYVLTVNAGGENISRKVVVK